MRLVQRHHRALCPTGMTGIMKISAQRQANTENGTVGTVGTVEKNGNEMQAQIGPERSESTEDDKGTSTCDPRSLKVVPILNG